ncbi:MAG: hypothetical protein U9R25_11645 [Chloroflexota bacterium]|nr:hypothetical protein [Chloroflexota bacterium]
MGLLYVYNPTGDVTEITDADYPARHFAYDNLARLCGGSYDGAGGSGQCGDAAYELAYGYDGTGNLVNKAGTTLAYFPHGTAQPHAVQSDGTHVYEYDQNGNMVTQQPSGGGSTVATYIWTADNSLASVNISGEGVSSFSYDADGTLVKETAADGTVTYYVGVYYEVQPVTGIITRYILVGGQQVASPALRACAV